MKFVGIDRLFGCAAFLLCLVVVTSLCQSLPATLTPSQQLFAAVQFLSPLPSGWSSTVPLEQWGSGVAVNGCLESNPALYSLTISPALAATFSSNSTLRLDLLSTVAPICSIVIVPSSTPLTVVVNFRGIPTALQQLSIPSQHLLTTSVLGPHDVDLRFLYPLAGTTQLINLVLSNCGIQGIVDLTMLIPNVFSRTLNVDLSNNPGIYGAVDLINVPICGLLLGQVPLIAINLTQTSLSTVVRSNVPLNACVSNEPPFGVSFISVFVEPDVSVLRVQSTPFPFVLDYGYYCLPVQSGTTNLPLMQVVSMYGFDTIRMINPPYECLMVLTRRFATYDIGFIYDSPAMANLYPCLPNTTLYATKTANVSYQIAVHDSTSPTAPLLVFGECPDPGPGMGEANYFSVSLGEHIFFDFNTNGYNLTARGLHPPGLYVECSFDWHYFTEVGVNTNTEHVIYNDAQLLVHLAPCLPTTQANGQPFGVWQHITYNVYENMLLFRDDMSNTLTLNKFQNTLVIPNITYCFTSSKYVYSWEVLPSSSTVIVTTSSGDIVRMCSYSGILQFLTTQAPSELNTLYALQNITDALGACLPLSASGTPRNWSTSLSRMELQQGSYIFGDLVLVDENTDEAFTFSNTTCALIPANTTYCSSVDLFTGSLILTVAEDRTTTLSYYRKGATLQNYTVCQSNNLPLLFDSTAEHNAFFLSNTTLNWFNCLPVRSNTADFGTNVSSITMSGDGSVISISTAPTAENPYGATVQLTHATCDVLSIDLNNIQNCPSLPMENSALTMSEFCVQGYCSEYRTVEWNAATTNSRSSGSLRSWTTGSASLTSPLPLLSVVSVGNSTGGTISTCYPSCFVQTTSCQQTAFVVVELVMCYLRHGEILRGALLPEIPSYCQADESVTLALQLADRVASYNIPAVEVQCLLNGIGLVATSPKGVPFVLSITEGVVNYPSLNTDGITVGLTALCTPCQSLWMQKLYPTPLGFIAMNTVFNMFLVLIANYVVEPLIGPQIAKVKVKFLVALGALSRREIKAYEVWLLRCLKPYIASPGEIMYHIDSISKIVSVERKKIAQAYEDEMLSDEDEHEAPHSGPLGEKTSASSGNLQRSLQDASCGTIAQKQSPTKGKPSSPIVPTTEGGRRRSVGVPTRSGFMWETEEERIEADHRFREILEAHLMCGVRMLGSVSESCLRKLVDLRDACSSHPLRTGSSQNLIRFPTKKNADSFMTEMTAENLLLLNEQIAAGDTPNDTFVSGSASTVSSENFHLEDAITAIDTDISAEWVPYVLAHEWMDRKFLAPTDWLLFLQILYIFVLFGRMFDVVVTQTGARGTWQVYSGFYFYFVSSSAPVALLVNAVFRVVYSRNVSLAVSTKHTWFSIYRAYLKALFHDAFFLIPFIMLLPAFVSHIVPGMIIFPFVLLAMLTFMKLTNQLLITMPEIDNSVGKLKRCSPRTIACIITRILHRNIVMFMCVAGTQLAFDYAMLFYLRFGDGVSSSSDSQWMDNSQLSWTDIITLDFNARSISCALVQIQQSAAGAWNMFYSQFG